METTDKRSKRAQKISDTLQTTYEIATTRAQDRLMQRNAAGRMVEKLTDEDWETVLDRIASGEVPAQVMRSFDVKPNALWAKEERDPDFAKALSKAYAHAFWDHMNDARAVARGIEGYSSGNIERDKLIVDVEWKMAKALVPRLVDKQAVDVRSISITVSRDDPSEW